MFCNKCGNEVKNNQLYCNKCGNRIDYSRQNNLSSYNEINSNNMINGINPYNTMNDINPYNTINDTNPNNTINSINSNNATNNYNQYSAMDYHKNYNLNKKKLNLFIPIIGGTLAIILVLGIAFYGLALSTKINYYFDDETLKGQSQQVGSQNNNDSNTGNNINNNNTNKKRKYKTDIITDNTYLGVTINNVSDAKKIIEQDSINQKQADYPKEIIQIENSIIQNYGITAVNLKEMDIQFAKELENVIKTIYEQYPKAREHLTNLTLTNVGISDGKVLAYFMPIFPFAASNTTTTRPWVMKTQVQLNSRYFLNPDNLEVAVKTSVQSGHFPKNATIYSPVAHELGHYLSFIALLNHYSTNSILIIDDNKMQNYYAIYEDFDKGHFSKQMLDEAYQNYLKDSNSSIGFDAWRNQISNYAMAKDDSGNYIYDETIAEAFHDVYLNKQNASTPSRYIVEVLKKYVGG